MINSFYLHKVKGLLFLLTLCLFFSGFYITGFESSSYSSTLRILLAISFCFLFFDGSIRDISIKTASNKCFLVSLAVFYIYIAVSSFVFEEMAVFRRAIIVTIFLFVVSFYTKLLRFDYSNLIYILGFFGFVIGCFYLYNYFSAEGLSFLGYRRNSIQGSGLSWLASYDNTITAALHLSVLCIAAVWGFFNSKIKAMSAFYYITFFILLSAIILTFARTAWVAVLTALFVFFMCELRRNKFRVLSLYGILFLLGVVYLFSFYGHEVSRGLSHRDQIWIGLLNDIDSVKSWMFGMGPAASVSFVEIAGGTIAVHAHNIYVETIYRNGVLGLALFLLVFFLAGRSLIMLRESRDKIFFLAVLCGASTSMFFDFSNLIYSPNLIWLWVWFPIAVSLSSEKST